MIRSLSFSDALIGIAIFTVELLKVAALRFTFIIYAMFISLVFYPLFAGFILNIFIVTIPLTYILLAIPALILGLCLALFMIIFREQFQKGSIAHLVFSVFLPTTIVGLICYKKPSLLDKALQITSSNSFHQFNVIDGVVLFLCVFLIASVIFAGGAIGGLLQTKISKKLLAPPTSVRQQLMMFKKKHHC